MIGACPFTQMHDVLMAEREALTSGDLHALDRIALRKEGALARLAKQRLSNAELEELQVLARRNAQLLGIVSQAIQAVRTMRQPGNSAPETLAYSADGMRHTLHVLPGRLAQKA